VKAGLWSNLIGNFIGVGKRKETNPIKQGKTTNAAASCDCMLSISIMLKLKRAELGDIGLVV
jgi:hypothetical protein